MINQSMIKRFEKHSVKLVDETIDISAVADKYKNICQSCGIKTVVGLVRQIPSSATVEHIKPLASGGSHTWDNVTLLCHSCNSSKNRKRQINKKVVKSFNVVLFGIRLSCELSHWKK